MIRVEDAEKVTGGMGNINVLKKCTWYITKTLSKEKKLLLTVVIEEQFALDSMLSVGTGEFRERNFYNYFSFI